MTQEHLLRRLLGGEKRRAAPRLPGGPEGLALARAAQETIGLPLGIRGLQRKRRDREALVADLDSDALLVAIGPGGAAAGLAAIEPQLRAAVVEAQTLGAPRASPVPSQPITGTEAAMMAPLLRGLLDRLAALEDDEPARLRELRPGARLSDARAAGLLLPEAEYDLLYFDLEIGPGSGRFGGLMLALPRPAVPLTEALQVRWAEALRGAVLQAPAELHVVLHRMQVPAAEIGSFAIGEKVPLPGVDLTAVALEDGQGHRIASVRLGQQAGLRAIRLAAPEIRPSSPIEIPSRPGGDAVQSAPGSSSSGGSRSASSCGRSRSRS